MGQNLCAQGRQKDRETMAPKFIKLFNKVFAPQRAGDYVIIDDPRGQPHAVYRPKYRQYKVRTKTTKTTRTTTKKAPAAGAKRTAKTTKATKTTKKATRPKPKPKPGAKKCGCGMCDGRR